MNGVRVFYRESREATDAPARPVMVHLHGFGMSSRYLVPTAELLAQDVHTLVPDLPGCGRSGRPAHAQEIPDLAHDVAAFLDDRDVATATLLGHSVGCAVVTEFARLYPERLDRAILVSPAGGTHNQPLRRAVGQLVHDGFREPAGLWPVAVADYVRFGVRSTERLFHTLTQYASMDRLLELDIPTLAVVGDCDPLLPGPVQLKRVAGQSATSAIVVVVEGAAHAVNFSHPDQLATIIRRFLADEPILDEPATPGVARTYELHRGAS